MSRPARFALAVLASLLVVGCHTSEVKNQVWVGLADDVPTGSAKSGYGDGHGDSIGGGGAAPVLDSDNHYAKAEGSK